MHGIIACLWLHIVHTNWSMREQTAGNLLCIDACSTFGGTCKVMSNYIMGCDRHHSQCIIDRNTLPHAVWTVYLVISQYLSPLPLYPLEFSPIPYPPQGTAQGTYPPPVTAQGTYPPPVTASPQVGFLLAVSCVIAVVPIAIILCVIASVGFLVGRYKLKQRRIQHTASIQVCTYVHIICSR